MALPALFILDALGDFMLFVDALLFVAASRFFGAASFFMAFVMSKDVIRAFATAALGFKAFLALPFAIAV